MSTLYERAWRRTLAVGGVCLITALAVEGCGKTAPARGGLMLIVSSDGPLPLDRLDIDVGNNSSGKTLLSKTYRVPQEASLPTTVAIVSNGDATAEVKISVTGWKGNVPLDRRDAVVTQIPTDRVAALTVVLSGRCSDKLTVDPEDGRAHSACGDGNTCDAKGNCVAAAVPASDLPVYHVGDENDAGVIGAAPDGGSGGRAGMGPGGGVSGAAPTGDGGASGEGRSPSAGTAGTVGTAGTGTGGTAGTAGTAGMAGNSCGGVVCQSPPPAACKDVSTQRAYASSGTCSGGACDYAITDTACGSNKQCGGAGVCSVCKSNSSCGASCSACPTATPLCADSGTTSKCVVCTSNAQCSAPLTCSSGACTCPLTTCGSSCTNTATDTANCGACGHSCQQGTCSASKCQPVILASAQSSPIGVITDGTTLLWSNAGDGSVHRYTLSTGSTASLTLPAYCGNTGGFALYGSQVAWAGVMNACSVTLPATGTVTDLGGDLFSGGGSLINQVALNIGGVYVLDVYDGFIESSLYGNYDYEPAYTTGIAADDTGIYWTQGRNSVRWHDTSHSASLSTGAITLVSGIQADNGIAAYAGYAYFTSTTSTTAATGAVYRIPNIAGQSPTTIATGQTNPVGIAVDASGVYWSNRAGTSGSIITAPLTGGTPTTLATGQNDPAGIAVDATTVYWTNNAGGQVMKVAK